MTATRPLRPRSPWASDEHELFRETARAWVEREILPNDEALAGAGLRRRRALAERGGGRAAGHRRAGGARRARGRLRLRVRRSTRSSCTRASRASARACTRSRRTTCSTTATDEQRRAWVPRARARRARGRDRDDRAGRRLRSARHLDLRRARRRPLRRQRHQDVHHERPAREPHLPRRAHRSRGRLAGLHAAHGRDRRPRGLHARPAAAQGRPARPGHVRAALQRLPRAGRGQPRRGAGALPPDAAAAVRAHRRRRHGRSRRSSA